MKSHAHAIFGSIALLCILGFWLSKLVSELFLSSRDAIVAVKGTILQAMWILIPTMAAAAGSGFSLSQGRSGRLIESKKKRMPFIAANGLLVLWMRGLFLRHRHVGRVGGGVTHGTNFLG